MTAALDDLKQRLLKSEEDDGAGHQQGEAAGQDEHEVEETSVHLPPLTVLRHAFRQLYHTDDLGREVASDHGQVCNSLEVLQGPPSLHPTAVIRVLAEVDGLQTPQRLLRHNSLRKGCEGVSAKVKSPQGQTALEPWEAGQGIS